METGIASLREIVAHEKAAALLACFFDRGRPFEGDLLQTLGENSPTSVNLDDLFATSLLDVRFAAPAVRRLLQDEGVQRQISTLLDVLPDMDIWTASERDLTKAEELYRVLHGAGVGPVTAAKLAARKRPRLIPIVDAVVTTILGTWWRGCLDLFRDYLSDESNRRAVESLAPSGLDSAVSILRIVDILLWIRGSMSTPAMLARRDAGYSLEEDIAFFLRTHAPAFGDDREASLWDCDRFAHLIVEALRSEKLSRDAVRGSLTRILGDGFSEYRAEQVFRSSKIWKVVP